MQTFTERAATLLLAENAFTPAVPGFVGAAADLPGTAPARRALRHGFLDTRGDGITVSVPPSPGLQSCVARLADDLREASPAAGHGGVRIGLEAGIDGPGPAGIAFRWRLAHQIAPVLAAAFAASPGNGWRSLRQSRHRHLPVVPPQPDPRRAWAAYVLGRPVAGFSLEELDHHTAALRPPVAARGHLEIDATDLPPGDTWQVPVAVVATLLDDPLAAEQAYAATAHLVTEEGLWERAAREALTDIVLADAARSLFLLAYGTLGRQGAARPIRDAIAEYTERYVLRGRTPADDPTHLTSGTTN